MISEIAQAEDREVWGVFVWGLYIGFFSGIALCGMIQAVMGR